MTTTHTRLTAADVLKMHPADLADRLQDVGSGEAVEHLRALPRDQAIRVVSEMDTDAVLRLTAVLTNEELDAFLRAMPHNRTADIMLGLPKARRTALLSQFAPEEAAELSRLLRYPEDSAGGIMSDRFIALPIDATIEDAIQIIRNKDPAALRGATYLYVVDEPGHLAGVITIRDLVFRKPEERLRDVLNTNVRVVRVYDDQEKVARQFSQYHFLALPVLERDGRLVGIVKADQAVSVAQEEATEDMQLMVGLSGEERTYTPWRAAIPRRLPWLMVNLATAFLAAAVVGMFESTIAKWTALAIFLPIVAGQGGNAGMQTLTVIIRGIALGEITGSAGRKALAKEAMLGLLNGLAVGVVVGVIGYWWKGSMLLGVVISIAMFLNMVAAALSGVLIPFALRALRIDPALASSIFLTTVTDVAGFFFFLGLAALTLGIWG